LYTEKYTIVQGLDLNRLKSLSSCMYSWKNTNLWHHVVQSLENGPVA